MWEISVAKSANDKIIRSATNPPSAQRIKRNWKNHKHIIFDSSLHSAIVFNSIFCNYMLFAYFDGTQSDGCESRQWVWMETLTCKSNGIKNYNNKWDKEEEEEDEQEKEGQQHFVALLSIALPFFLSWDLSLLSVCIARMSQFIYYMNLSFWFGIFDAMRAETKEQQLEQENENERKPKKKQRRNRERQKEMIANANTVFFIFLFFIALLPSFEHIASFALLHLTEGNPNSDKFCETPPDTPTGAKLCQ